jgi:hypothetical protein
MSENTNPVEGSVNTVSDAANAFLSMMDTPEEKAQAQSQSDDTETEVQDSDESYEDESAEETVEYEEETPKAKTFRVKVGNEEVEVSEDELLSGYSRTADYTKKTQALAETRKAVEAERGLVEESKKMRDLYAQRLEAIESVLQSQSNVENLQELKETDPIGYAIAVAERSENEKRLQAVQAERQNLAQQQDNDRQQALQKHLAEASEQLKEAIPEFRDAAKAEIVRRDIRTYAKSIGFSDQELSQVYDPRAVKTLYNAMMYEKLSGNKGAAVKKVQDAPKVLKSGTSNPGSSQNEQMKKQFSRLQKTGKKADAAKLFEQFI